MFWKYMFFTAVFVNVFLSFVFAGDDEDEICNCILLEVSSDVGSCSGWEDAPIEVKLMLTPKEGKGDEPDMMVLDGHIKANDEVSSGYNINININADTANGKELVWTGGADVCQSMSDTEAPWYPLLAPFNTTECPIVKDTYPVSGLYMTLSFLDGYVTEDFVGSYMLAITIEHAADKIMCFELGADIYKEDRPCKYCPGSEKNRK